MKEMKDYLTSIHDPTRYLESFLTDLSTFIRLEII